MTKKITIAIDAMGGDNSPEKTINGVGLFIKENSLNNDFQLNLFGDEIKINEKLKKYNIPKDNIKIILTPSKTFPSALKIASTSMYGILSASPTRFATLLANKPITKLFRTYITIQIPTTLRKTRTKFPLTKSLL